MANCCLRLTNGRRKFAHGRQLRQQSVIFRAGWRRLLALLQSLLLLDMSLLHLLRLTLVLLLYLLLARLASLLLL